MRAQRERLSVALLLALGLSLGWTVGCTQKSRDKTSSPTAQGGDSSAPAGDPLAQLDSLEREMLRLGMPVAAQRDAVPPAETGEGAAGLDGDAMLGGEAEALAEEQPAPTATEAAEAEPPPGPERRNERQHCADVCDLSRAICELEAQICSLSDGHGDDPTYADACRRAGEDCDTADAHCDRCSGE
jgi:hypothetical protein